MESAWGSRLKRWFARHFITQSEVNERIGGMMSEYNVFQHNQDNPPPVKKGWRKINQIDSMDYHVVPVDDDIEHGATRNCPCGPENITDLDDGTTRVIHKAWDGREKP